jgi:hypothetical protein
VPRHDAAAIARAGQAHGLSAKNTEALLGELEGAPHVGAPGLARASSSSPFADDKAVVSENEKMGEVSYCIFCTNFGLDIIIMILLFHRAQKCSAPPKSKVQSPKH